MAHFSPKVLVFSTALRGDSLNRKLVNVVARSLVSRPGIQVDLLDFAALGIPLYNADVEGGNGVPEGVQVLAARIAEADGLLIASPEYNGSISGVFKNAIDWVSRVPGRPWNRKMIQLVSASPGVYGGVRGLWHARVPLEVLGAIVLPKMVSVPKADQAFDSVGELIQSDVTRRIEEALDEFALWLNRCSPVKKID